MKIVIISKFNCQSFPLNEKAIEINEETLNQIGKTKCFDVENNCVVDYDNSNDLKEREKQKQISELDSWFKTDYTTYEQMLVRRSYLNLDDEIVDNFRNKTYHDLFELYTEAEVVAKEIRELRNNTKEASNAN